jgi:L-asparaginase / beta-aspartyl-peptidase
MNRTTVRALPAAAALVLAAACAPTTAPMPQPEAQPSSQATSASTAGEARVAIVIHGGAGTITRDAMTPEREREYTDRLTEALQAGHHILAGGGSSLDAVVAAINVMEDSPLFNAGRGAVFTAEGTNELDASIMEGATLNAGAVAGVKRVKNPINLARLVMEESPHVLMAREGAEHFGEQHRVEMVDPSYFHTDHRWEALQRALQRDEISLSEDEVEVMQAEHPDDFKLGTVGAVALDAQGNLAAGTSTGGMTAKRFGRIGDSPIIGAGTYAENESCAVSATGHGEYFIRAAVAYDICARMKYLGETLRVAADQVIMEKLVEMGATGGVVALDRQGNIAMPFNTAGMYRGYVDVDGNLVVEIYRD